VPYEQGAKASSQHGERPWFGLNQVALWAWVKEVHYVMALSHGFSKRQGVWMIYNDSSELTIDFYTKTGNKQQ